MSDPVRDRLQALRADWIASAVPPGVAAVRRRVARRRAIRAAALGIGAILILLLTWLPSLGGPGGHPPIEPPTPSGAPSGGTRPPATPRTTATRPTACSNAMYLVGGDTPDTYSFSPALRSNCPQVTELRLVRVSYIGAGTSPATLSRYSSVTHTISAASPIAAFAPGKLPGGGCHSYIIATIVSPGGGSPSFVPHYVDSSTGEDVEDQLRAHLFPAGYGVIDAAGGEVGC